MKLPIKKEFFDKILNGEKEVDFRDAHITFICEETGRQIRKKILHVTMMSIACVPEELHYLFEDQEVIVFHFGKEGI